MAASAPSEAARASPVTADGLLNGETVGPTAAGPSPRLFDATTEADTGVSEVSGTNWERKSPPPVKVSPVLSVTR